jgi:hypothetical protein
MLLRPDGGVASALRNWGLDFAFIPKAAQHLAAVGEAVQGFDTAIRKLFHQVKKPRDGGGPVLPIFYAASVRQGG